MSEELRMWVEMIFDVSYLLVIWSTVVLMTLRQSRVAPEDQKVSNRFRLAFFLLALGDTGHVGFRVVAYARGGLEANPVLVGAGALSTAITVTFFYMLMVDAWRLRFKKPLGWFGWLLLAAGVVRLVVMAFPQNQWWQVDPPYPMSLVRNGFLVLQGLGVMALILRDAARANDGPFRWVGIMIALSYLFYTPVILFTRWVPMLGMLMIPKTCAYLGAAFIAYRAFYATPEKEPAPVAVG